jgi:hypothetical protein
MITTCERPIAVGPVDGQFEGEIDSTLTGRFTTGAQMDGMEVTDFLSDVVLFPIYIWL